MSLHRPLISMTAYYISMLETIDSQSTSYQVIHVYIVYIMDHYGIMFLI